MVYSLCYGNPGVINPRLYAESKYIGQSIEANSQTDSRRISGSHKLLSAKTIWIRASDATTSEDLPDISLRLLHVHNFQVALTSSKYIVSFEGITPSLKALVELSVYVCSGAGATAAFNIETPLHVVVLGVGPIPPYQMQQKPTLGIAGMAMCSTSFWSGQLRADIDEKEDISPLQIFFDENTLLTSSLNNTVECSLTGLGL
ncbi:hypothetical protein BU17DRAFT_87654 [Hysterangium stoloniferum]|nr:hypothetical protein BU17DRAFT_87654 [Hysterangium stoloniferum]